MAKTKAAPKVDYGLLEDDWIAGIKTSRQMAEDYEVLTGQKVSHVSIVKHFEKRGLARDLKAKIKLKAEELVNREQVNKEANELTRSREKEVIEVAARNQADIILRHRTDVQRYKNLASQLLAELEATTGNLELFNQLGELLHAPDDKGMDKLNEAYQKVISLPQRTSTMKQLAETLKILIGLERQAFGVSDNANGDADQPKAPELSPNDAARRVGFVLAKALLGGK